MRLHNFYLDEEIHQNFKILAARESRSMTDIIVELIEEYLKKHIEGNPQHLITSSMDNEDFTGFPNITLDPEKKRKYLKKLPKKMIEELRFNVDEWSGMIKEL